MPSKLAYNEITEHAELTKALRQLPQYQRFYRNLLACSRPQARSSLKAHSKAVASCLTVTKTYALSSARPVTARHPNGLCLYCARGVSDDSDDEEQKVCLRCLGTQYMAALYSSLRAARNDHTAHSNCAQPFTESSQSQSVHLSHISSGLSMPGLLLSQPPPSSPLQPSIPTGNPEFTRVPELLATNRQLLNK
ncbi:hypothetical protein ACHAQJ_005242 [Trichoderma viride]